MLISVSPFLPCCLVVLLPCYSVQTCHKHKITVQVLLSTLPTRENVLAPGYLRISWPPSPNPPATRASLIKMIQPVSPVSLSEHTHTSQSRARLTVKRIPELFFPRPFHLRMARTSPSSPALFLPANSHSLLTNHPRPPSCISLKIFNLLGIFWAFRPAYTTFGSLRHPSFALFYFFSFNLCSQFIK
jgi:hypothetical protein